MGISSFVFDSRRLYRFLQFGQELYHADSNYLPVDIKNIAGLFAPQNSFHFREGNAHRNFIATCHGEILGRISAFRNNDLKDRDGEPVGLVGFFECINDYDIASELLQAAINWLHREQSLHRIWGPMNSDIWHGYRFKTQGFEHDTFMGEPYNKCYYPEYFERFGFRITQQWDTVEIHGRELLHGLIKKDLAFRDTLRANGYRFEPFRKKHFSSEINRVHSMIQDSFKGFLGFTPIREHDFARLFLPVRPILDPRFFVMAYDEQSQEAGFAGAFPDISDWLRIARGKNRFWGKLKFLIHRPPVCKILFYFGGITQQEAARRNGLGKAIFGHVLEQILAARIDRVIFALMSADSRARGFMKGNWTTGHRQYALYQYDVQK